MKALEELKSGNQRFVDGKSQHSLADPARRKELAQTEHPSPVVLSCSDSRVPPEIVFDKGLGELFTVRVAGNALGPATVASIEYAVEHLGSTLIVILGHESCGAVKAAISAPLGQSAGSPDLDSLISSMKPGLRNLGRELASDDVTLRRPVMQNVNFVGERLLKRSRIVRNRVAEGKLAVVYGIYGLESGHVDFWHDGGSSSK
jgi:carbonic anhydrase